MDYHSPMSEHKTPAVVTLLQRLRELHPQAKQTTLREMVAGKRVLVNGRPALSLKMVIGKKDRLEVGDREVATSRKITFTHGLKLVHMDSDVVLVDKPSGMLSATDAQEKRPTVLKVLTAYFQKQNQKNQIHLVHRLDRDASGLLLFARNWGAFRLLKEQFFEHTITRRYEMIVKGVPRKKSGRLEHLLVEDPLTGVVSVTKDSKKGKLAILDYEVLQEAPKIEPAGVTHVRCTLFTGRKHQIRLQMLARGHPVLGDPADGLGTKGPEFSRLALHAAHLTFKHPGSGKRGAYDSPMPGSFSHLLRG